MQKTLKVLFILSILIYGITAAKPGFALGLGPTLTPIPNSTVPTPTGYLTLPAPPTLQLKLSVGLNPRNQAGFDQAVASLYTPGSPNYHRYLSHYNIANLYGPTADQYQAVSNYLQAQGLTLSSGPDSFSMNVAGTVAQIESAFNVQINLYTNGSITYYANPNPALLPSDIAPIVSSVVGLENVTQLLPQLAMASDPSLAGLSPIQAISLKQTQLIQQGIINTNGGLANAFAQPPYAPSSTQLAYNETGILNHQITPCGSNTIPCGQYTNGLFLTVAVVDAYGDPTAVADLNAYDLTFNQTNLENTNYPICLLNETIGGQIGLVPICYGAITPSFSVLTPFGTPDPSQSVNGISQLWEVESALDIQLAHATAPGANIVSVVTPDSSLTLIQGVAFVIVNGLANVISQSFGSADKVAGPQNTYMHVYYQMAAAEGISVLASSGDWGAYDPSQSFVSTMWPASDSFVTAVGGTTLFMNGIATAPVNNPLNGPPSVPEVISPNSRANETTWQGYGGGGFSTVVSKPSWQTGPGVPTSGPNAGFRGVPDVAAAAFFGSSMFYVNGLIAGSYLFGGTSLSSPLTAGMIATMDSYLIQYTATFGFIGFINPVLYQILGSPLYHNAFNDITALCNSNPPGRPFGYCAGANWDPVTGVGSFNVGELTSVLSVYSFITGVRGSSNTATNTGASVNIQTSIPTQTFGGLDLYYLTETLPNGAQLFVGTSEATPGSTFGLNSWFYGAIPANQQFSTFYFSFGPANSAGANGVWNTYTLAQSGSQWAFTMNGAQLGSYNANTTGSGIPIALADAFGVTNTANRLQAGFSQLSAVINGKLTPLTSGFYFTSTRYLDIPPATQPFTNPYGVRLIKANNWVAGSGLPTPANNTRLWGHGTLAGDTETPASTTQAAPLSPATILFTTIGASMLLLVRKRKLNYTSHTDLKNLK